MKDIKGFEGLYAVTSCGRVWSYRRKKFLKPGNNRKGYFHVDLYKNGKHYNKRIHRLVADAYIPNPNNYDTVDHIDNNKSNNCINNLQWMTRIDNNSKERPEQTPIRIRCTETNVISKIEKYGFPFMVKQILKNKDGTGVDVAYMEPFLLTGKEEL